MFSCVAGVYAIRGPLGFFSWQARSASHRDREIRAVTHSGPLHSGAFLTVRSETLNCSPIFSAVFCRGEIISSLLSVLVCPRAALLLLRLPVQLPHEICPPPGPPVGWSPNRVRVLLLEPIEEEEKVE